MILQNIVTIIAREYFSLQDETKDISYQLTGTRQEINVTLG